MDDLPTLGEKWLHEPRKIPRQDILIPCPMEQLGKVYPWWTSSHETKTRLLPRQNWFFWHVAWFFSQCFFCGLKVEDSEIPGWKEQFTNTWLGKKREIKRPWPPFFDWFRSFIMFQVVYHHPKGHQKEPPIFDQIWWQRLITYLYTWNPFWWPDTVKQLSVSFVGHVGIVEMVGGESWGRWEPICCLHILGRSEQWKEGPLVVYTLQGTNISPKNGILKMIFLFPRWDMLIPWRVCPLLGVSKHHL